MPDSPVRIILVRSLVVVGHEQQSTYFRRPHWSVRYLVVMAFDRNATVPYTPASASIVRDCMPSDLYRVAFRQGQSSLPDRPLAYFGSTVVFCQYASVLYTLTQKLTCITLTPVKAVIVCTAIDLHCISQVHGLVNDVDVHKRPTPEEAEEKVRF